MLNEQEQRTPSRRRRHLIDRRIQLKFVATFAATAGIAVLVQAIVTGYVLSTVVEQAPNDRLLLLAAAPRATAIGVLTSFLLLMPAAALMGVMLTFPIAGPLYRFKQHLASIARGERPGPCKIREGDELQDLCELLNAAVDSLQSETRAPDAGEEQRRAA